MQTGVDDQAAGTRYARKLPYETLKIQGDKLTLPGATKDALKTLPEFKYASN